MSKTIAYIRVSTDKQDVQNQKYEILEYANRNGLKIDEWMEVNLSSRKTTKERRIDELVEKLQPSDTLIVTELSRLGRSTVEVVDLINRLLKWTVKLIAVKQGLNLTVHDMSSKILVTMFSLLAELERDLISLRVREALAAKKSQGVRLGKPKGTVQPSKFDADRQRIQELLDLGVSVNHIAKAHLGLKSANSLYTYLRKRGISAKQR